VLKRRPDFASKAPGRFHGGESLAGNDSSELRSTISIDSDPRKTRRLERSKSNVAAIKDASPRRYLNRRAIVNTPFNYATCMLERRGGSRTEADATECPQDFLLHYRPTEFLFDSIHGTVKSASSLA